MAENKTRPTEQSVDRFIAAIPDERKRQDCRTLVEMMREITGVEAEMWGAAIVGFGRYRYTYASGRSGEFFLTGFSPRKQNLTLYITDGFAEHGQLLEALGKHSCGKSCLYLKSLDQVDRPTLRELIRRSVDHMRATNPSP